MVAALFFSFRKHDVYHSGIFLNWSLVFHGTLTNPSHQLPTTTMANMALANVHLHHPDQSDNSIARSRSTLFNNYHNFHYSRHREKNRKNKQQQQQQKHHYYIQHHYHPYDSVASSSRSPSMSDDIYTVEMSKANNRMNSSSPFLTFIFVVVLIAINHLT
jgi:hypothetical protein